ncbi:MAG TPA: Ig-like domain-containing protein [Kofleriaceae bacterium]|nr:Ig-like domain-containing protein [Kofleriaceae bacterium]
MSVFARWSFGVWLLVVVGACDGDNRLTGDTGNTAPFVDPIRVTTIEDVPVDIRVLASSLDPDGDPLVVTRATAGGHGATVLPGGVIRVTPLKNFNGTIVVDFRVSDGTAGQAFVSVLSVDDAPVALSDSQMVHRSATIRLRASDAEGDPISYEIVTGPEHGTLTGEPPNVEYTAESGFFGEDQIVFRVRGSGGPSEPATFLLEVAQDQAPSAFSGSALASEDQAIGIFLSGTDPELDPLTYTIEQAPQHGTLSGTAPALVYTPDQDFHGNDSFKFSVRDGLLTSNTATISLTVSPVNDPPVATGQTISTSEDAPVTVTLAGSDVDGDSLSFQVQQNPLNGTITPGFGAVRTYTPAANFHGTDSFTYRVSDIFTSSSTVTVTIDVTSVEDPPVAASFTRMLSEDVPVSFALQGSDGDGDPIEYALASQPANGTLTGTPPNVTYTPNLNFNGQDSFTYTVTSGGTTSPAGTVTLKVASVNDPPVASSGSVTTAEDTPVNFTMEATDVENQTLTFSVSTPADGTVSGSGATRKYTPAPNVSGTRTLSFSACDPGGLCSSATITVQITPVNDPPVTADDFVFTEAGAPVTFDVAGNDSDPEGDPFEVTDATPAHGTVAVVDGELLYTPAADFIGVDVFTYTVVDALGASSTGVAHVGVGTFPPGAPAETIATVGGLLSTVDGIPPAISSDGRFIAFTTALPLATGDTNNFDDVYLYDRGTRTLSRASVSSTGGEGNGASRHPRLSADGRYVVFDSSATNLVAGDSNVQIDVFRHDRVTGETIRVSVATGDAQASGGSATPDISDDGNRVVFASTAFDLVPGDTNGSIDVFLRDVAAGTTTRVSVNSAGGQGDLGSSSAAISGDGNHVVFTSLATNLVNGDTNSVADIFARDLVTGTTARVNVSSTGAEANQLSSLPAVSRDGTVFGFLSNATNLVSPTTSTTQVYIRDLPGGPITRRPVTTNSNMVWTRLSGDGRYVVEFSSSGVIVCDRVTPTTATPSGAANWFWPSLSGNGKYMVVLEKKQGNVVTVMPNPLNP